MARELAENSRALDGLDRRTADLEKQLGAATAQLGKLQTQLTETTARADAAVDRTGTLAMVELVTALRRPGGFELELAALRATMFDPGQRAGRQRRSGWGGDQRADDHRSPPGSLGRLSRGCQGAGRGGCRRPAAQRPDHAACWEDANAEARKDVAPRTRTLSLRGDGYAARNAAMFGCAFSAAISCSLGNCGLSRAAFTMQRKPSGSPSVARN
jgi:hypothetical protein